jgi:hypothetical protein
LRLLGNLYQPRTDQTGVESLVQWHGIDAWRGVSRLWLGRVKKDVAPNHTACSSLCDENKLLWMSIARLTRCPFRILLVKWPLTSDKKKTKSLFSAIIAA